MFTSHNPVSFTSTTARLGFFAVPTTPVKPVSKKKILIVDDQAINRKVLNRMLSDCLCVEVSSGEQAVEEVKKAFGGTPFDLILMDLEMPGIGGQLATQAIRELGSLVPIICVSTKVNNQVDLENYASGMNDFLPKLPVKKAELDQVIKKYSLSVPLTESDRPATLNGVVSSPISFFKTTAMAIPNAEPTSPINLSSMGLAANCEEALPGALISPTWQATSLRCVG